MKRYVQNFLDYYELFVELIKKDIKLKYRNSVLGILWSMLNPVLMMFVLAIIFMQFFKTSIENFLVYVLIGRILYQFFSESTSFALTSIEQNANLIKKVYVPKYFFPLTKICSTFITTLLSFVPLFIVMLFTGVKLTWSALLVVYPIICLFMICVGIGLILSTITVFFKDIKHLYSIITMIIMYLTPIFYPVSIIPEKIVPYLYINPLFTVVESIRGYLLYGTSSSLLFNGIMLVNVILYLSIGLIVFYKKQDKFIYHL